MDFVAAAVRGGKAKEWLGELDARHGKALVESVIHWTQMTDDDVSESRCTSKLDSHLTNAG
jgi:hypothetical protein